MGASLKGIPAVARLAATLALAACSATEPMAVRGYSAVLAGARVRPTATGSQATGTATLRDSADGLAYEVTTTAFSTPITVIHLHLGVATDDIGAVLANLPVRAASGVVAAGRLDLRGYVTYNNLTIAGDSVRGLLRARFVYVDVHTAAFPGGELRGQLVPQ